MKSAPALSALKDLHALLGDSRKGYRFASSKVELPELSAFLTERSMERRKLQEDLAAVIQDLSFGQVGVDDGSMKGTMHRVWADLRERFSCWDDAAVLDECERGDRYLLERFSAVWEDQRTPTEALQTVRKQRSLIEEQLASLERTNDALLARI
ncbi:MAG: PA2169 family four-helix-bundle protein [Flavobacteriales bacterium]